MKKIEYLSIYVMGALIVLLVALAIIKLLGG